MNPFDAMMIENDVISFDKKIATAIKRIKYYAEAAHGAPILCAFSGGKDSQVIYQLAKEAGVAVSPQYSITRFEPPELMRFIREHYPEVAIRRAYKQTLVAEIEKRGLPTRWARWCCSSKHAKTEGFSHVLIGVRWEESPRRRDTWRMQGFAPDKTSYLCPIADWTSHDVWGFIKSRNMPYCSLYDEGLKRIGCVCCPLAPNKMKRESERWPKTAAVLRVGADAFVGRMRAAGFVTARGKLCADWHHASDPAAEYWNRWIATGQNAMPIVIERRAKRNENSHCLFAGTGFSESDGEGGQE